MGSTNGRSNRVGSADGRSDRAGAKTVRVLSPNDAEKLEGVKSGLSLMPSVESPKQTRDRNGLFSLRRPLFDEFALPAMRRRRWQQVGTRSGEPRGLGL